MIAFSKKNLAEIQAKGGAVRMREADQPSSRPAESIKPLIDALAAGQQASMQASEAMLTKVVDVIQAQSEASTALVAKLDAIGSHVDHEAIGPVIAALTAANDASARASSEMLTKLTDAAKTIARQNRSKPYTFEIERDENGLIKRVIAKPDDNQPPLLVMGNT